MLAFRNSRPNAELDRLSAKITANLLGLQEVQSAHAISTYLHIGSEVRTNKIVEWALLKGKKVIVPISNRITKTLAFSEVRDPQTELEKGTFGILEPKPEFRRIVPLESVDIVLVPGLAWDRRGFRLGYGVGFYDRSINHLKSRVTMIGLAYEFQLLKGIPTTRYDRRVDRIVTELGVIKPNSPDGFAK
jgi:5-formyltetrahydrofolate cyclo-ligase